MKQHFLYDGIVLFDGNITNIKNKLSLKKKDNNLNLLGLTFNHREFKINEINNIRSEVENLDLDHLMFSIRPSANLKRSKDFNLFLQLIFAIKISKIYEIKKIFISDDYRALLKKKDKIFFLLSNYLKALVQSKDNSFTFFKSINSDDLIVDNKIDFINLSNYNTSGFKYKKYTDINKKNHKFFWLGFDRDFQEVPWEKKYKKDYWYKVSKKTKSSQPLFSKMKYCSRCCLPESWEGMTFDKEGICSICRSSEDKMIIEWKAKEKNLKEILYSHKKKDYYDCILPISGGKDSTFQSYVLTKKYQLNPLAITHGQNWYSLTGRENLENCLKQFDLDHIFFCASRKKINSVAKKSLNLIGDSCWHCHVGVGTFAIQTSFDWKINLIVYGEAPADTDARGSFKKNNERVSPYRFLEQSAIEKNTKFTDKEFDLKKLSNWSYPSHKELFKFDPYIIHLGQYIFWDEQKNIDFVSKYFGWKNTKAENTYKGYKSNECTMAGVHDYLNFLKRGIGRASVHASDDVRRGLITREQGFELIKKHDIQKPHALEYYKKITGLKNKDIKKNISIAKKKSKYAKKFTL